MCWSILQRGGFLHSADAQGLNDKMGCVSTDSPTVSRMFHAAPRPSSGSPRRASFPQGKLLYRAFGRYHSTVRVIYVTVYGDESSPLHCVVLFIYTGYIRNVAGGRVVAPTDTPEGGAVHPHGLYLGRGGCGAVPGGVFPPRRFYDPFTLPGFPALHGGGIMHPVNKKSKTKRNLRRKKL